MCPLCRTDDVHGFASAAGRRYWRCGTCNLAFVDAGQLPTRDAEVAHYRTHENRPDDPGYRRFLAKLATPLLQRLSPASAGLDYGCGPGPTLSVMLAEAGHSVAIYDPFFATDASVLQRRYAFVTCTEVAEHFHDPRAEFERLAGLLEPGGVLAVMTEPRPAEAGAFADWWYLRDPTHVALYASETFDWLGKRLGLKVERAQRTVWFLGAPSTPPADGSLPARQYGP